jgi:hypothetical protein
VRHIHTDTDTPSYISIQVRAYRHTNISFISMSNVSKRSRRACERAPTLQIWPFFRFTEGVRASDAEIVLLATLDWILVERCAASVYLWYCIFFQVPNQRVTITLQALCSRHTSNTHMDPCTRAACFLGGGGAHAWNVLY